MRFDRLCFFLFSNTFYRSVWYFLLLTTLSVYYHITLNRWFVFGYPFTLSQSHLSRNDHWLFELILQLVQQVQGALTVIKIKSILAIIIIYHKIINTYLVLCVIQCLPQCPNHQGFHGKKMWLEGDFVRHELGKNSLLWIETHILGNNKSWKLQCCQPTMDWDSCFFCGKLILQQ